MNGSKKENGAKWTQMSEEKLTGHMKKAANKLAEFIAKDLSLDDENAAIPASVVNPEPEDQIESESAPDA